MNKHRKRYHWIITSFYYAFVPFIGLLALTSCGSSQTEVVHGVDENNANQIIVFLAGKNIDATKVPSTLNKGGGGNNAALADSWDVDVSSDKAIEAMNYLNAEGLPKRPSETLLDLFSQSSLVPSAMQEKIRYQAGLEQELANTIRKIDGVVDVSVLISFPEQDPLDPSKNLQPVTASIFVKHNGVLQDPNLFLVPKIKQLVAASIPGLKYDNVTVISSLATLNENATEMWESNQDQDNQLVNVWTVTLAKDSVPRFHLIFFSFISLLVLFFLLILWLLWKIYPILKEQGLGKLFNFHSFSSTLPQVTEPIDTNANEESKDEKGFDET